MACILTLEITPEIYQSAFRESISFQNIWDYKDMVCLVRALLVADVVRKYFTCEKRKAWEQFYKKELKKYQMNIQSLEKQRGEQNDENPYVVIIPNFEMLEYFSEYLRIAAGDFYDMLQKISKVEQFRDEVKDMLGKPAEQTLLEILKGGIYGDTFYRRYSRKTWKRCYF